MKAFHSFRLDSVNQCLWRGDQRVAITPKAFDVLRYLVEHPGRLVTQEELLQTLWPKTYVNQEVIKKYILAIRKALDDRGGSPVFIETLPRRGYQFIAPVIDEAAAPSVSSGIEERPLVGRDGALATLEGLLEKARRGRRQIVFIIGEPGIGKTALVDACLQGPAGRSNVRIGRGQCVEGFGGKEAYYPMLDALGKLAREAHGAPIVQTLAVRAPTWLVQFPSLVKTNQREALQREILGATRERMLREICEALEMLTATDPLILVLEDLHWVDPSTVDLISALARRREAAKLAVLVTYRPLDVGLAQSPLRGLQHDLQRHGLCQEIVLERLSMADVAQYLTTQFSSDLPANLAALVHQHSAGNPLFMVAMVQEMQKRRWIARDEGAWKLTVSLDRADLGIAETLQQMLDGQFDELSAAEQQLLRVASVAGERFSVALLSLSLDVASDRIEEMCEGLAKREHFVKPAGIEGATGGLAAVYEFTHSLYRESIYRRLSEAVRSRLHLKIAEQLALLRRPSEDGYELAAELARHFEYGRDYARAIDYLIEAAENAGRRFGYRESIRILDHALELLPAVRSEARAGLDCRIRELIGDAHFALGAMADSAKAYEDAAARAARANLRSVQVSALGALVRPLGLIDPDRAIVVMDRAARLGDGLDDPLLAARTRLLAAATRLLYDTWRADDAALCASAYQAIRRLSASDEPSYHQVIYAHVRTFQGHYAEALAIFEHAASQLAGSASLMTHFFALSGKTLALLRCGRLGEVLRIVRDGKLAAAKNGNDPWLFNFREAWLRLVAFDFEGARALCEAMIGSGAEYPTDQPRAIARVSEGYAALDRGDSTWAIECFHQVADARSTSKFFAHWIWRLTAHLGLTEAWLASADLSNAREACDLFATDALATADPHFRALAWDAKARVAMAQQSWHEAREHIDRALAALEGFAVPMAAWRVHATAQDWHTRAGEAVTAETHRAAAEHYLVAVADSFSADEPLRASLLAATPVRRILGPLGR